MAGSIITGKTFEEMISEATVLDLSARFKDQIHEFSDDVHAMGIVIYVHEDGESKFLFKDPEFIKPISDYDLLAIYLDEVVATYLTENNTVLSRYRDLESASVKYLEYKDANIAKRFYQIGNFYSGETYRDLNGYVPGAKPVSVVGKAIVGKAIVS